MDFEHNGLVPHLSDLDVDPQQIILVEDDNGNIVEMTVEEALEMEERDSKELYDYL